jgi:hypothetical protein
MTLKTYFHYNDEPIIGHTFLTGGNNGKHRSVVLAIPKHLAIQYDIQRTNVVITPTEEGIFIRKLVIQ